MKTQVAQACCMLAAWSGCSPSLRAAVARHDAAVGAAEASGAEGGDARLRGRRRSGRSRRRARLRRRVAARDRRRSSRALVDAQARHDRAVVPRPRDELEGERRRQGLDVQAPPGREVPRRHAFNAEAVCFNFNRWYNFKGALQNAGATLLLAGASSAASRTTRSAAPRTQPLQELRGERHATACVTLTKPSARSSRRSSLPVVLDREPDGAEEVRREPGHASTRTASSRRRARTRTEHPTGTGPVQVRVVDRRARSSTLVPQRRLLGRQGEARHADLPARSPTTPPACRRCRPARSRATTSSSRRTSRRSRATRTCRSSTGPPFNVGYVGINQAKPPIDKLKVRQAVAYGLDRQAVVNNFYAGRGRWRSSSCRRALRLRRRRARSTTTTRTRRSSCSSRPASRCRSRSTSGTRPTSRGRTCRTRSGTSRRSRRA